MGRITGSILRAFLVLVLVLAPAFAVPGLSVSGWQLALILGLFCSLLTVVEYLCETAVFIDFRDAPPFNRIRFMNLLSMVCLVCLVVSPAQDRSLLADFLYSAGLLITNESSSSLLPIWLVIEPLTINLHVDDALRVQAAVGVAFCAIILSTLGYFTWTLVQSWPRSDVRGFNFWVNKPTFDPTAKGDIVWRIRREGWINIALGGASPFLAPLFLAQLAAFFGVTADISVHTVIWLISLWAFLPINFVMQGMAMLYVANLIKAERKRYAAQNDDQSLHVT